MTTNERLILEQGEDGFCNLDGVRFSLCTLPLYDSELNAALGEREGEGSCTLASMGHQEKRACMCVCTENYDTMCTYIHVCIGALVMYN